MIWLKGGANLERKTLAKLVIGGLLKQRYVLLLGHQSDSHVQRLIWPEQTHAEPALSTGLQHCWDGHHVVPATRAHTHTHTVVGLPDKQ